jgi:hypothetical protein
MPFLEDGTPVDDRAQPARRAQPYERRPDPRDPPGLGRGARLPGRDAGVRRREREHEIRGDEAARAAAGPGDRPSRAPRDPARDARGGKVTSSTTAAPASRSTSGHGRLHLHAQAAPPRRRQDPRPRDRPVLADHAAAAGRQGPPAASASARWRSGPWRPTARRTSCRSCSRSRATTSRAGPRSTSRWSRAEHAGGRHAGQLRRALQRDPRPGLNISWRRSSSDGAAPAGVSPEELTASGAAAPDSRACGNADVTGSRLFDRVRAPSHPHRRRIDTIQRHPRNGRRAMYADGVLCLALAPGGRECQTGDGE